MRPFPSAWELSHPKPMTSLQWLFIASRYQVSPAVAAEVQSFLLVVQCVLGGHPAELINACCVAPAAGCLMWGALRQVGICQEKAIHFSLDCAVSLGFCRLPQTQERKVTRAFVYPQSCPPLTNYSSPGLSTPHKTKVCGTAAGL